MCENQQVLYFRVESASLALIVSMFGTVLQEAPELFLRGRGGEVHHGYKADCWHHSLHYQIILLWMIFQTLTE